VRIRVNLLTGLRGPLRLAFGRFLLFTLLGQGLALLCSRGSHLGIALATGFFHSAAMTCTARFTSSAANFRHVLSILAHRDSALAPCGASFIAGEFVGAPAFMRSFSTLSGNFALAIRIHAAKSAFFGSRARIVTRHDFNSIRLIGSSASKCRARAERRVCQTSLFRPGNAWGISRPL